MSSTTTNIALYKKNPSTDGNDTFDINTMLNDNWDKIDAKIGAEVAASPAPTAVKLVNGLQVVDVARSSPFNVVNVVGRTLVNLLGRDGNFENNTFSKWGMGSGTIASDATTYSIGSISGKFTLNATAMGFGAYSFTYKAGKYYIVIADTKNGNAATGIKIGNNDLQSSWNTDSAKWTTQYIKRYYPSTDRVDYALFNVGGTSGQFAYIDAFRVYEVTLAEYNAIDNMTAGQIAAKYPYVDDVKHVNAPYVIKYGENLLPTFNEWSDGGAPSTSTRTVVDPYKAQFVAVDNSAETLRYYDIPVKVGETYTFSNALGGIYRLTQLDANQNHNGAPRNIVLSGQSVTVTMASNASFLRIHITNTTANGVNPDATNTSTGTFIFSNPMLNLGATAKPFKPRNDDMLQFPNVQLASSVDGTVYDTLFKRDGKYFVEKRFRDMVIDGSLSWFYGADASGYKKVYINTVTNMYASQSTKSVVKYDGKILTNYSGSENAPDIAYTNGATNVLELWIADTDSGWGEIYTPTAQEIQAYFYGWKMYDSISNPGGGGTYNGTGTKTWCYRDSNNAFNGGTTTLPTTWAPASTKWTPYKLTYQLATPTFEEIQVDGSMSLQEGLNQIDVGQGVVVREKANPKSDTVNTFMNNSYIPVENMFKLRAGKILQVYKNGRSDNVWKHSQSLYIYGTDGMVTPIANFDPTATYEATYIAVDQYLLSSPVQTLSGEYASNLKTIADQLSTNQADAEARISANEILARQIYNVPQKTSANITLYVDASNGADNNDGSAGSPLKTIQAAVNRIPQIVNNTVIINVATGGYTEDVLMEGFVGKGSITLNGNMTTPTNVSFSSIVVSRNLCTTTVQGVAATTTTSISFLAHRTLGILFDTCITTVANSLGHAFSFNYSTGRVQNCIGSNRSAFASISSSSGSSVISINNAGTGNLIGLQSANGSFLTKSGTQPSGTTLEVISSGTLTSGVLNPWGDNTFANRSSASAFASGAQALTAGATTKVLYPSTNYDNLTELSSSRFTAKKAGRYLVQATVLFANPASTTSVSVIMYVNGSGNANIGSANITNGANWTIGGSFPVKLNANDYVEIYAYTGAANTPAAGSLFNVDQIS